jgi:polar amino acid transport system substrate-binding protein
VRQEHRAVQKGTVQADDLPARQKTCTDAGKPEINVIVDADQGKVTTNQRLGQGRRDARGLPPASTPRQTNGGQLERSVTSTTAAPYGYVLPKDQTEFGQAIADALKSLDVRCTTRRS